MRFSIMKHLAAIVMVTGSLVSGDSIAACRQPRPHRGQPPVRFLIHDGEVTEPARQLVWQRCPVGMSWSQNLGCTGKPALMSVKEAIRYAGNLGSGWRVPTIDELAGLIDDSCSHPAINGRVFPGVRALGENAAPYWSQTPFEDLPDLSYYVDFMAGAVDARSRQLTLAVRLVRSVK